MNKSLPKNRLNWKACKKMSCSMQHLAEEMTNTEAIINWVLKGISQLCEEQMMSGCSCSNLILSCCTPGFGYCCCWRTFPSKSWLIASFTGAAKQQIIPIFALVKTSLARFFSEIIEWSCSQAVMNNLWDSVMVYFEFNKWMTARGGWGQQCKPWILCILNIFCSCCWVTCSVPALPWQGLVTDSRNST